MRAATPVIAVLPLLASFASAHDAYASEAIEKALGGSFIACRGAISWAPETVGNPPNVEALQIAVRDDADASAVALFHREMDFTSSDVWDCAEGICTHFRPLGSGVTTNVLRLTPGSELGGGSIEYRLEAIFQVIGVSAAGLEPLSTSGLGALICDRSLPNGVVDAGK